MLRNLLGVKDPAEIGRREQEALLRAQLWALGELSSDDIIDFGLLCTLHRRWLGGIYTFAGELRRVNISKGGILFAPVEHLASSVRNLDAVLDEHTPCRLNDPQMLAESIATVHVMLVLVHPFREGNGRLGRWLADIMANQAGHGAIDWGPLSVETRETYFACMRRGFSGEIAPLTEFIQSRL